MATADQRWLKLADEYESKGLAYQDVTIDPHTSDQEKRVLWALWVRAHKQGHSPPANTVGGPLPPQTCPVEGCRYRRPTP